MWALPYQSPTPTALVLPDEAQSSWVLTSQGTWPRPAFGSPAHFSLAPASQARLLLPRNAQCPRLLVSNRLSRLEREPSNPPPSLQACVFINLRRWCQAHRPRLEGHLTPLCSSHHQMGGERRHQHTHSGCESLLTDGGLSGSDPALQLGTPSQPAV